MKQLIGTWQGTGNAFYPTIETARYREVLTFREHDDKPIVQYEQKTWRLHDDGTETLLHWEFGFIRQLDDETYEWVNSQNNGRVEVLNGDVTLKDNVLILRFKSSAFANDPRMVASTRQYEVKDGILWYLVSMTTQSNRKHDAHLEATLEQAD